MPHHATRAAADRRTAAVGLTVLAATGLTGCGPDLGTPEGVTGAFVEAMAERRYEDACGLLSHDLVHRTMEGQSQYCAVHLERRHPDTSGYDDLVVQGTAESTADGHRLLVAPEDDPGRTEEVTVVEESGRLLLLDYPGRDSAAR